MLLECQEVTVETGGRSILGPVDARFEPGRLNAIIGPSGSGKTTLLNCLGLLLHPTTGTVLLDGQSVTRRDRRRRSLFWRQDCALILQDFGIIDDQCLDFNVTMKLGWLGRARRDVGRAEQALTATGLEGRGAEPAAHLSGGEKQRLSIARAIHKNATVILADEPTASLDSGNRERVIDLLRQRADAGCNVIIATHDDRLIDQCDHTIDLS